MILQKNCYFYSNYNDSTKKWFLQILEKIINTTKFTGHGIDISDEIKITISGWGARMLIGMPLGAYYVSHVEVIKVYPGYKVEDKVLGRYQDGSFYGHIQLDWENIQKEIKSPNKGSSTIIHEFAHSIDAIDRIIDGTPSGVLLKSERDSWKEVFNSNYILNNPKGKKIWKYLELKRWDDWPDIDISEMFATASEKYFEDPIKLNRLAPEIYEQLKILYKQDMLQSCKFELSKLIPLIRQRGHNVFNNMFGKYKK